MHLIKHKIAIDPFWDGVVPPELPHTLASIKLNNNPPETSTAAIKVSNEEKEIVLPTLLTMPMIVKTNIKFRKRTAIAAKRQQRLLAEAEEKALKETTKLPSIENIKKIESEELKEINVISSTPP